MALRTIMESLGVVGAKGQPVSIAEERRAEEMTPEELLAELESLRSARHNA
jgi:hypothetical protein